MSIGDVFRELGLTFVPLFIAMDSVGNLPILLSLTQDMKAGERNHAVRLAMFTALGIGLGFVAIGKAVFLLLGIEVADFLVAGGIILLVLSVKDLVTGRMVETQSLSSGSVGAVPLGTPLVVGPAVLTTLLLLTDLYSVIIVIVSFILNLAITWILFSQVNRIMKILGHTGARAISKIVSLLLAAIAVKMIRRGVLAILE